MKKSNSPDEKAVVFAVDLGGTHLRAAIVDETGQLRSRLKQNTPRAAKANEIVRAVVDAAHTFRQQSGGGSCIRAVSVVVPGTVNTQEGVVVKAPNVPGLDGFRLSAALESELKLPAILENDANAAAVGEAWQGVARGRHSIVCVTLGTGVGGGIILEDRLWR